MSDVDPIEVRAREHARAALDKWENTQGVGLDESMAIGFAKALRIERELALRKAARIAREGCLVPPDGGSPTAEETTLCDHIAARIMALLTLSETPDAG